jgi:hypothetical protein
MLLSFYVHLLPAHAAALAGVRTTTVWQMNTTDPRALWNANQTQRNGNVTQTVDSAGTTRFVYDGDNRLTQET